MRRRHGLKSTYYVWFLLLVVLPILAITATGTLLVVKRQLTEANETIDTVHYSVSSALEEEVRQASLGLAYFLQGSEQTGRLLEKLPENQSERYANAQELQKHFEYFAFQAKNIEALHLYLADGTYYGLSAQLAASAADAAQENIYQKAIQNPNKVAVGSVSPTLLHYATTHHGNVLLSAAMSVLQPREQTALTVASLYFSTSTESLIEEYNSTMAAASSFLVEGTKVLAGDRYAFHAARQCLLTDGQEMQDYDWCALTRIPHTDLGILTLVDNQKLLSPYYATLGVILLAILAMLGLFVLFTRLFFHSIVQPLDELSEGMDYLQTGDFSHRLTPKGHVELRHLEENFNETASRMEALMSENQARENEKYQEELKALQSEINPHFLLNTVNTIRFMAEMAHYDSIRDMAASLMKILHCVLRNPNDRYTFADELDLLRSYVHIMEVRLPGGFMVEYDIAPESLACRTPKLLLQPLVENAIRHAFPEYEIPGTITVSSRVENQQLVIQVRDNGVGIPPEKLAAWKNADTASSCSSIGMVNVKRRLELNCGDQHAMDIVSDPEHGTVITMILPANYLPEGDVH